MQWYCWVGLYLIIGVIVLFTINKPTSAVGLWERTFIVLLWPITLLVWVVVALDVDDDY